MPRSLRAVTALAAVVLLVGSVLVTNAHGELVSARSAVVHDFGIRPARVRTFWTRERMRAAPPIATDQVVSQDLAADAPYETFEIEDPSQYPYRLHGKLFVRAGRSLYQCSATVLDGSNKSVVFTAAHCLYGDDIGGWVDSAMFVPGYESGNRPYGEWVAKSALVTPGWLQEESERVDIGAMVMEPLDGSRIVEVVGGRSITVGAEREQHFEAYGYPAASPYDGEHLFVCDADAYWRDSSAPGSGPDTTGIGCDMTQGSSGGGWIINGESLNSVSSYGYADQNGKELEVMFGPYFGAIAGALFEEASLVPVEVPVPTVSPSLSPLPSPSTPPVERIEANVADADDSRSRLDLASSSVSEEAGTLSIDLSTHDGWAARVLGLGRNSIGLRLDTTGDGSADYRIAIRYRDGALVGRVLELLPGEAVVVGAASVTRPTRRQLSVVLSTDLLGAAPTAFSAQSTFRSATRCLSTCRDKAPDVGMVSL